MPEGVELSPVVIIYAIGLFLVGIFFLVKDIRNKPKLIARVRPFQSTWIDFGLLICVLIVIMYVTQQVWVLIPVSLASPWADVIPGFLIQFVTLAFIYISLKQAPNLFDSPVNVKESSFLGAGLEGVKSFLSAIPIVWLVNFLWMQVIDVWKKLGFDIDIPHQELVELFALSDSPLFIVTVVFFGVIVAPITEEFIFRAALYRFLKGRVGRLVAISLSAFVFAWVHYNVMSFLPLFVLGLLLARAYERTGNVTTNIVFHALFNANTLFILLVNPKLPLLG